MLRNLFGINPERLPQVRVAQRVIDKIVAAAMIYETETGEVLVGFPVAVTERQEPDLYVVDTIAPDESAVRLGAYFEQGDEWQEAIFNWWEDNWRAMRARGTDMAGQPIADHFRQALAHLGNWHKHPGTYVVPSDGDLDTALSDLIDSETGMPQLLVFLATVWDNRDPFVPPPDAVEDELAAINQMAGVVAAAPPETPPSAGNSDPAQPATPVAPTSETGDWLVVPISDSIAVRIDCWYISRYIRRFVRVKPHVVPNETLPALPTIGWHLANTERMRVERESLKRLKFSVKFVQYDADGVPPMEICGWMWRAQSPSIIFLVTGADYPAHMPKVRITPVSAIKGLADEKDLFGKLWAASTPLPESAYPPWPWTPEKTLADLAVYVEAKLLEGKTA